MNASDVSRAILLAHDPYGGGGPVSGKRYACPLPECAGKPVDKAHRSLSVHADTGVWNCKRCQASGLLIEHRGQGGSATAPLWTPRRPQSPTRALPPPPPKPQLDPDVRAQLRSATADCRSIIGTPGAAYLATRAIDAEAADACGARYHPHWLGVGEAVVFPARDDSGKLMAAQGRFISPRHEPKAMTKGTLLFGVFATPGALESPFVAITEAPIDALSLAICGIAAIALFGTSLKESPRVTWLRRRLAFATAVLATDADEPGELAAARLRQILTHGTRCERLTLPPGMKDVNEALVADFDDLERRVSALRTRAAAPFTTEPNASHSLHVGAHS